MFGGVDDRKSLPLDSLTSTNGSCPETAHIVPISHHKPPSSRLSTAAWRSARL